MTTDSDVVFGKTQQPFGPLTRHMAQWHQMLNHHRQRPARRVLRLLLFFQGNEMSLVAVALTLLLTAADAGSPPFTWQFSFQYLAGIPGGFIAQFAMLRRCREFECCFRELWRAVAKVELRALPCTQVRMRNTARRSRRVIYVYTAYGTFALVAFLPTITAATPRVSRLAARAVQQLFDCSSSTTTSLEVVFHSGEVCVQLGYVVSAVACFYPMLSLIFIVYNACSDLHDAAGRGFESQPFDRLWAESQRAALRAALTMDGVLVNILPLLLMACVVMPLLSTVEVVDRGTEVGSFVFAMMLLVVMVFVPVALVGDALQSARQAVCGRAFRGPWLEESPRQRRLRATVMAAAGARGAGLWCRGIGTMDRPACADKMRAWFKFLQVVINVQNKVDAER